MTNVSKENISEWNLSFQENRTTHLEKDVMVELIHEIRSPLMVLLMKCQRVHEHVLALLQPFPQIKETSKAHLVLDELQDIHRMGQRISELTHHLSVWTRQSSEISKERTKIIQILGDVLEMLRMRLEENEVKLELEVDSSLEVLCHPRQLGRAIENIITNAIEAVAGSNANHSRWIQIQSKVIENEVILTVSDSGKVMSEDLQRQIMKPFYSTKASGFGIGLSIVQKIIAEHGGRFFYDADCPWTTFVIVLPVLSSF